MGRNPGNRSCGWLLYGLLVFVLLLQLAGCNSASTELIVYRATGSWEGTVGGEPVRAIVAPDGVFHMAILDAGGNAAGEYSGQLFVSQDNVGRGRVTYHRGDVTAGVGELAVLIRSGQITGSIKLDNETTSRPLQLQATADASGPAEQDDAEGRWSVTSGNIVDMVITPAGIISGGVGGNCTYSGSVELYSRDWNIYRFTLKIQTVPAKPNCQERGDYQGLAMLMGEPATKRLWFSGDDAFTGAMVSGTWQVTQNVAPLAVLTELSGRTIRAISGVTQVSFDGSGSSDANRDSLTYLWSGVDPDGNTLLFAAPNAATTSFLPVATGDYTITLTVSDGQLTTSAVTTVTVTQVPFRFRDNGNGTVTDMTSSPQLVWLKDAGCVSRVSVDQATIAIASLASGPAGTLGLCGLTDGSVTGDWRLPSKVELEFLVDRRFSTPPALSDTTGRGQWSNGDAFTNFAPGPQYLYWTSTPVPDLPTNFFFVNFFDGSAGDGFGGVEFNAWPVRALRPEELPLVP